MTTARLQQSRVRHERARAAKRKRSGHKKQVQAFEFDRQRLTVLRSKAIKVE